MLGRIDGAPSSSLDGGVDPVPAPPTQASGPFGPALPIAELAEPAASEQDPTLTADELEIFFTRLEDGQFDIWTSTRASRADPWLSPTRVAELSNSAEDSTPEVSADGLFLYFASKRADSAMLHLWSTERQTRSGPWAAPVVVQNPTPGTKDLAPSLDRSGRWLALASVRTQGGLDLYLCERASTNDAWAEPQPLSDVNRSDADDFDPALFADATELVFSSQRDDQGNLFHSSRRDTSSDFAPPTPLDELNTTAAEGDPWVSSDGHDVYFASTRNGVVRLFGASR